MNLLAISGSGRRASTNTAMLRTVSAIAQPDHRVIVFDRVSDLPVFSPDLEAQPLPKPVQEFTTLVGACDALIISSPEYVRAIPGGLKNAIDWLVSREEIIDKPIALMHASQRGDDMLLQLRMVLSTVSARFSHELFLRFELSNKSPEEIAVFLERPLHRQEIIEFMRDIRAYCGR